MRRKIVRHGRSTLTISLPNKWVRKQGISPGDELEVIEKGQALQVGADTEPPAKMLTVDLSDSGNMLMRTVAGIYKAGFDKVKINFNEPVELERIQDAIYRFCHTFEIISIDKNSISIKSISRLNPVYFEPMMKTSFSSVLEIASDAVKAIQENDHDALSKLVLKERMVDRHLAYGKRVLNKGYDLGCLVGPMYTIFQQSSNAADIIKRLSRDIVDNKTELCRGLVTLLEGIVQMMEYQYSLVYHFSAKRLKALSESREELARQIDSIGRSGVNVRTLAYAISLFDTVSDMRDAIIALQLERTKAA